MFFRIEPLQKGCFRLVGELTFETVPGAYKQSLALFDMAREDLRIDLGGVSHTDSAGIVLLISWVRYANEKNKALQFLNMPAQMRAIAQAGGLERILPLGKGNSKC